MTSVLQVVKEGTGHIPANFRLIPESARRKVETLNKMNNIGISGVIKMGKSGDPVLGIPVVDEMVGIAAVASGINPLCAAKEAGFNVNIRLAEKSWNFPPWKN